MRRCRLRLYPLIAGVLVLVATAACGPLPSTASRSGTAPATPVSTPAAETIVWGRVPTQCT
jgi:hypothetical protein